MDGSCLVPVLTAAFANEFYSNRNFMVSNIMLKVFGRPNIFCPMAVYIEACILKPVSWGLHIKGLSRTVFNNDICITMYYYVYMYVHSYVATYCAICMITYSLCIHQLRLIKHKNDNKTLHT